VANDSGLLADELTAGEDSEVWNSSDVETSRQLLVFVGVDFENNGMPSHVGGRPRHLWGCSPTGPAPLCPEIDKHRNVRALNDFIE
jgi:hypothetical protein